MEKRPELHTVFTQNLDPIRIIKELSIDRGSPIYPEKTLLFIDEIQACPQAILALRYFYEEMPKLHVIGAASLLEFALQQVGIPVGRVQTLTVYPLSFAEFLAAKGCELILQAICEKTPFSEVIHEKTMKILAEYFVIGGLPEVVVKWIQTEQLPSTQETLRSIINTYRQDFEKYGKKLS